MIQWNKELYHYGIPRRSGRYKWGSGANPFHHGSDGGAKRKRRYSSLSPSAAIARRQNAKVDKSFQKWRTGAANRDKAIELGRHRNELKIASSNDKHNKDLKKEYRSANKEYKSALKQNTAYRKGTVRQEVGKDLARKHLSEARKADKILRNDPKNRAAQKQYSKNMRAHDVERAKARKAQAVGSKRSQYKAGIKRRMTMTLKAAAASGAIAGGVYVANKYGNVDLDSDKVRSAIRTGRRMMGIGGYFY